MQTQGMIFDIQRFSVNDGSGIRTTVFLKGCPLNCLWCHNPESKSPRPQLMLHASRCVGCGECVIACSKNLHAFLPTGEHTIDRENCLICGNCIDVCVGALECTGKQTTVAEVLNEVEKDRTFYENSGGGITLSGGEPLMQFEFTLALLRAAKKRGLHTAIETCGFAPWERIEKLMAYVDLFLWDCKEGDEEKHRSYTGVSNRQILENLEKLSRAGARIVLRCPIIPSYNDRDEHFAFIGALAERLEGVERVDVEPYHPMGASKCEALGQSYPLQEIGFAEEAQTREWIDAITAYTDKPVKKA